MNKDDEFIDLKKDYKWKINTENLEISSFNINDFIKEENNKVYKSIYKNLLENYNNLFEKLLLYPLFNETYHFGEIKQVYIDRVNLCLQILKEKAKEYE